MRGLSTFHHRYLFHCYKDLGKSSFVYFFYYIQVFNFQTYLQNL
jgi:hypothetical protein